jgi:purine-nucleoside phosphorylase
MQHLVPLINESAVAIQARWSSRPRAGIILGTGLGNLAEQIAGAVKLDYEEIPHFPRSTALGHKGQLLCGELAGVPVVTMEGRFHLYEGYDPAEVSLPVWVMKQLGIELLIISNASGGLNPQYSSGDIMIVEDHINLMFGNPLVGINDDSLGPRFPDMSRPYDQRLVDRALSIARQEGWAVHRGVYVAMTGPSYETRAEYRFLRRIGGDVVGMSTVPEVIAARHAGLRVMALSTVTNMCLPDAIETTTGEDVMRIAAAVEPKLRTIVHRVLQEEVSG